MIKNVIVFDVIFNVVDGVLITFIATSATTIVCLKIFVPNVILIYSVCQFPQAKGPFSVLIAPNITIIIPPLLKLIHVLDNSPV